MHMLVYKAICFMCWIKRQSLHQPPVCLQLPATQYSTHKIRNRDNLVGKDFMHFVEQCDSMLRICMLDTLLMQFVCQRRCRWSGRSARGGQESIESFLLKYVHKLCRTLHTYTTHVINMHVLCVLSKFQDEQGSTQNNVWLEYKIYLCTHQTDC